MKDQKKTKEQLINELAGVRQRVAGLEESEAARKRAERESEERWLYLESVLACAPDAIVTLDARHNVLEWNPGAERLFGYTLEEVVGRNIDDLITGPDTDVFDEATGLTRRILAGESVPATEMVRYRKDGSPVDVIASGSPILIGDEVVGVVVVYTDITERKRAEQEIKHRAAQLATLHDSSAAVASRLTLKEILDTVVQSLSETFDYRLISIYLIEEGVLELKAYIGYGASLDPGITHVTLEKGVVGRTVRTGQPQLVTNVEEDPDFFYGAPGITSEICVPLKRGDEVLGVLSVESDRVAQPLDGSDLQLLALLSNHIVIALENARLYETAQRELAERKRAEEELKEYSERLEEMVEERTAELQAYYARQDTILRSVGDAILMTDPEQRVVYVNPAFTTLTGYTADDLLGKQSSLLGERAVTEQVLQSIGSALVKGEVWQGEMTGRRKDGRTYDATLTVAPVHDDEGRLTGYVSSHRDITRLKDLDRARSRFITNVSHQLRTPVTTIQLYTHLLRDEDMSEKAKQFSQAIKGEVTRLIHLIEDIIVMATLDSGQILDVWKPVPLPAVVESIVTLYEDQARASGLTLEAMPLPPDLPVVNGDHARLAQALGEVVENAVIFTPAGGQVAVEVETVEDEGRAWVMISVRDTGPGISPEEQEKVFDRFFRGSLAESGHVPGTGLGLSITQEVIRAHGGRVTVESELGQGSTFRLWLPAAEGGE